MLTAYYACCHLLLLSVNVVNVKLTRVTACQIVEVSRNPYTPMIQFNHNQNQLCRPPQQQLFNRSTRRSHLKQSSVPWKTWLPIQQDKLWIHYNGRPINCHGRMQIAICSCRHQGCIDAQLQSYYFCLQLWNSYSWISILRHGELILALNCHVFYIVLRHAASSKRTTTPEYKTPLLPLDTR